MVVGSGGALLLLFLLNLRAAVVALALVVVLVLVIITYSCLALVLDPFGVCVCGKGSDRGPNGGSRDMSCWRGLRKPTPHLSPRRKG